MSKLTVNQDLKFDIEAGYKDTSFWVWYESHKKDVVLRVGFWIVKFDIKVEELRPLFEKIFGANPFK